MTDPAIRKIFDELRQCPDIPSDPNLRLDKFGFIVERHTHAECRALGWYVENGKVKSNLVGKPPLMG